MCKWAMLGVMVGIIEMGSMKGSVDAKVGVPGETWWWSVLWVIVGVEPEMGGSVNGYLIYVETGSRQTCQW